MMKFRREKIQKLFCTRGEEIEMYTVNEFRRVERIDVLEEKTLKLK